MQHPFIADKTFKDFNNVKQRLTKAEYENCIFERCNFADGDLANQNFMECKFIACNLSNTNLTNTIFKDCLFKESKMVGVKFSDCNSFLMSFTFENCILDFASFYQLKIKNTRFIASKLEGVDFTETDLSGCQFDRCDLKGAIFQHSLLERADFRTAFNYSLDPEINRIKKALFAAPEVVGLLQKYDIVIEQQ
ncbi:pentapeptide repeat-containing protein [Kriegella aquimaris]|uniref:Uncharacterized protein YjbI, contains pentapeptide repeats n=1 Tax=Kriegella aquimaris TaxID=192904 RepID=A0A1G9SRE6_9FLAO|nr:pentapeptide repeat-containing protein [Kriegella aquimaris]SDM38048.1 Uncharacterized protein YjbI, contains pentapeptide repeats [Kriegella aquimaris]